MNRIMTYLRTCLCFLMLLFCCISPVHGFGITAMAAGPGYGPGAYTEQDKLFFDGGEVHLLQSMNDGTILSCLIRTKNGNLIVVDGGRENESDYLVTKIRELGGRVSLWLVTHPHDDHVGALTKLLSMERLPVEIDRIAWNFLSPEQYGLGEHMERLGDMNAFLEALQNYPDERKITGMAAMQQLDLGDAVVTALNEPVYFDKATFNNSSILYRIEMDGRRILITGDMGALEAEYLMQNADSSIFQADVLQVAHHGNGKDSATTDFYRAVSPTVCLWPSTTWIWNSEEFENPRLRDELTGMGAKLHLSCSSGDKILR